MPRKYFHVSSALNRRSIEEHGLDSRRMGATHGVAGVPGISNRPEVDGIFLLDSEDEIAWFAHMALEQGHAAVDVWEITLPDDAKLVGSAEGYQYAPNPVPLAALRLHIREWTTRDPGNVASDFFHPIYYGDGDVNPDLLDEAVVVVDVNGRANQGHAALQRWAKERAHGAPPDPEPDKEGVIRLEISGSTGFSIEGLDDDRCLVSPAADADFWTVVRVRDNRIVELREYKARDEIGVPDE